MSDEASLRDKTAILTRILNMQGTIGMFGHVSVRVPGTDKCFISPGASTEKATVGPEHIFVYNIDGTFYATEARCTHATADLADGILEGDVIECSLHFGAFHVPTGKAVQAPCFIDLKTFRTEVKDGQVLVDLEAPAATAS